MSEADLAREIATAILAIDTLWGGDVMDTSGAGRFIADSWFSEEPLPEAYIHPAAARLRATGGVAGRTPDRAAVDTYLAAIDVKGWLEQDLRGAIPCLEPLHLEHAHGHASPWGLKVRPVPR